MARDQRSDSTRRVERSAPAWRSRRPPCPTNERKRQARSPAEAGSKVLPGLNLRDYFAGQALSGMCSASDEPAHGLAMQRKMAETAYQIADAMLARREALSDR